jgi:WD40 repeat protein
MWIALFIVVSVTFAQDGSVLTPENIGSASVLAQFDAPDADSLVISPDGSLLASYAEGGSVTTWDISGEEPAQLAVIDVMANDVTFSPDSSQLVIASMRVEAYDPASGEELLEYGVFSVGTWAIDFAPDGASLAAQVGVNEADNTVAIYDSESGQLTRVLASTTNARSIAYSSDGVMLAWDNPVMEIVTVSDISSSVPSTVHQIGSSDVTIHALDFSSDGALLAGGYDDGTQYVWSVENGAADFRFTDPIGGAVRYLEFSPNGDMLAVVGSEGQFVVRDMNLGSVVLEGDGNMRGFVWLPDGTALITLDDSGVASLWGVAE